jgi:hypothetical protein
MQDISELGLCHSKRGRKDGEEKEAQAFLRPVTSPPSPHLSIMCVFVMVREAWRYLVTTVIMATLNNEFQIATLS